MQNAPYSTKNTYVIPRESKAKYNILYRIPILMLFQEKYRLSFIRRVTSAFECGPGYVVHF